MRMIPALVLILFGLIGCETIGGAGQDIENAGEFIQQESAEVQAGQ